MTRLTDADMCIAKIKELPVTYDAETVQRCIEVVSNAPTIDAVPVKRGHWIEKSTGGEYFDRCSECGYIEWGAPNNYCPECGARMDKE